MVVVIEDLVSTGNLIKLWFARLEKDFVCFSVFLDGCLCSLNDLFKKNNPLDVPDCMNV